MSRVFIFITLPLIILCVFCFIIFKPKLIDWFSLSNFLYVEHKISELISDKQTFSSLQAWKREIQHIISIFFFFSFTGNTQTVVMYIIIIITGHDIGVTTTKKLAQPSMESLLSWWWLNSLCQWQFPFCAVKMDAVLITVKEVKNVYPPLTFNNHIQRKIYCSFT